MVKFQSEHNLNENVAPQTEAGFLSEIERVRRRAVSGLDDTRRAPLGQFFTPLPIARMMSEMPTLNIKLETVRLLDAGAGAGVLTAAFIATVCKRQDKPKEINVTAVEFENALIPHLQNTLEKCRKECEKNEIKFSYRIYNEDFIKFAVNNFSPNLFASAPSGLKFDLAILNPPYGKINAGSEMSRCLRRRGIVAPNLYAAFLALCAEMLEAGGELVAITPRSFCNGTYFKPFRRFFLERMSFLNFHVFDSRKEIFDEDILQENIIFHAVKDKSETRGESEVIVTTSLNGSEGGSSIRLKREELIKPGDDDLYIHIGGEVPKQNENGRIEQFENALADLGLQVSTGRVVDFRAKEFLRNGSSEDSAAPLIYPHNLREGRVQYPVAHKKKFDSIRIASKTESLLVETGTYVLVKRFSAKEEKKRITAALFEPKDAPEKKIGFENHLNYFHASGCGLNPDLAKGLTLFLNSSRLDDYFRRFSGHTQVNATDLRYLRYPTRAQLETLGEYFPEAINSQEKIDFLIERILLQ